MIALAWPIALVVVASLAAYIARLHIQTRRDVTETRILDIEGRLEALKDTGKVLASLNTRLGGVERALKAEITGGE